MEPINPALLERELARDHIQSAMDERRWTQADLARATSLPRYTISRVMRLATALSPEVRQKIAIALSIEESLGVDTSTPAHTIRANVEFTYHRNHDGSSYVRLEGTLRRNVALVIDALINDDRDISSERLLNILTCISAD